jgi:TonB-linked SusC/RagA family outer membrane protein
MSYAYQDGLLEQSAYFASPRAAKYFTSPIRLPYNDDGSINISNFGNDYNPLWIAENDKNDSKVTRIITNNAIKWDTPVKGLSFESRYSIDWQSIRYNSYGNRQHGGSVDTKGYASLSTLSRVTSVLQNSVSYNYILNGDHNFNVKAVQEYQKSKAFETFSDGEQFAADGLINLSSAGKPTSASSEFTDWSIASYLAIFDYSYKSKYLFSASFRREANSRFPKDFRWGSFYSIGVGWNLHQESFLANSTFINNLKLRTSFGRTGNSGIDPNTYQASLGFDADYGGTAAVYPAAFGNSVLSWEKMNSFEAGVDFAVWNNRVSGALNYYSRKTYDMLQEVPLSFTTGFDEQNQNIGEMVNNGIEFNIDVTAVKTNDLTINIGGNIGTNKNEVKKMALDGNGEEIFITTGTRRAAVNHTAYEWYMVSYAGVNPDNGNALYYTDATRKETTEDFGAAERAFQGAGAVPTLLAGLNLNVNYKGFYVTAQMNYAGGHKVWEPWSRYTQGGDRFATDFFNGINTLMDRWQQPGDITNVPKITHTIEPWRTHSRFLHDGDYIRLRNLTVGYNVNSKFLEKTPFTAANVFVRGINLYTWVKDKDLKFDPEVRSDGFIKLTTPPTKTIIFGVNLKF